jgi:ubiquitin-protein ligase
MNDTQTITVKRLLKDVRQIIKHPLNQNGIYYIHDETNIMRGYAMIVGPSDTPYFGGYYFFMFDYPVDYPFSPPKVTFMTNDGNTRFHPNLYRCGKVCLSILNTWEGEKWSACQNINTVLLALCSLFVENPLENEPTANINTDNDEHAITSFFNNKTNNESRAEEFIRYKDSISFRNIEFAICDIVDPDKETPIYLTNFRKMFSQWIESHFFQNYSSILRFVDSHDEPIRAINIVGYNMTTIINYCSLKLKLTSLHSKMNQTITKILHIP